ncbi:MAG: sulfotransferase domain-containing protein [Phycisphaerales bacterium JB039]
MSGRLPDFLIIGAQKAGTTTLYRDLETHPQIAFSYHKEPHCLCFDRVLTARGRREYEGYFSKIGPEQICGDASTGYTKIPEWTGVPKRAMAVLGDDVRLIYIVRNPVDRAVSHHHHVFSEGLMPASFDEALERDERLIAFGKYAMQAEAWLEVYPAGKLRIIVFEEYLKRRRETIAELQEFLGVAPKPELVDPESRFNAADQRLAMRGLLREITRSSLYSRTVRRWTGPALRGRIAATLGLAHKAPARPAPPRPESVERLLEATRADQARLMQLLGRTAPVWDEQATRQRWQAAATRATPSPA